MGSKDRITKKQDGRGTDVLDEFFGVIFYNDKKLLYDYHPFFISENLIKLLLFFDIFEPFFANLLNQIGV